MSRLNKVASWVAGVACLVAVQGPATARNASPDDTARFLAGMQPAAGSALAPLTRHPAWQRHARWFDDAWETLDRRQVSKIRTWSDQHIKDAKSPLYYMFSGPDFLYADAFFPNASTYVLSGLEPVGSIPNVTERTVAALPRIQSSIGTSVRLSFFITRDMRQQLQGGELSGTLPILYVYIARAGKTISEATLINLDKDGEVHAGEGEVRGTVPGVKIVFAGKGGPPQTLYYFRTDVSDSGVKNSGFLKFSEKFGTGNALLKSASYLMHSSNFAMVRDFVIEHSNTVVQDDSGIPLASFKRDNWQLSPFGKYLGPIAIFPGRSQPKLADMFKKGNPPPLEFGIGYRWRGFDSNLLLAVKKDPARVPAVASAAPARVDTTAPPLRGTIEVPKTQEAVVSPLKGHEPDLQQKQEAVAR
jgi:hypothetical protein